MREPRWDGSMKEREERWRAAKKIGNRGEYVIDGMLALGLDKYEVKTDTRTIQTRNVYIERQCEYNSEWAASGIDKTQASVWFYIASIKPFVMVALQPDSIRRAIHNEPLITAANTTPKTKGVLIRMNELLNRVLTDIHRRQP